MRRPCRDILGVWVWVCVGLGVWAAIKVVGLMVEDAKCHKALAKLAAFECLSYLLRLHAFTSQVSSPCFRVCAYGVCGEQVFVVCSGAGECDSCLECGTCLDTCLCRCRHTVGTPSSASGCRPGVGVAVVLQCVCLDRCV